MSEASYPDDRRYHDAHGWVQLDGDIARLGVTWHAQQALGEVVYYAPPEVGATIHAGDGYGELESVKAVSDVIAPIGGEVLEVNERVVDSPEFVNADPYGAWLVAVRVTGPDEVEALLDSSEYQALLSSDDS